MLGSIGSFGLAGLLAFSPPGEARSLRVQVELPADVEPGPYRGLLSCPDQDRVLVEVGVDGEVSVEGPDGAVCLLDVQLSPGRHLQVQVELGEHSFARVAGVEVEVEAAPVSEPTVIDMEHAKNIPVGESTSREFTAVVDMAPAASRDAAGISLAGSTSAETRLMVVGGATVESFAPGTLTAAGVDDLATSGGFARFMAENGPVDPMPRLGRRWVGLQILDPRGRPARGVPVRLGDRELKTHADGRVVFLEDWDGPFSGRKVLLDVDGRRRVRVRPGRVETVKMGVPRRQDRHRVDLALVLDTTGSMGDELAYLQVELRSVFDRIAAEFPDVDVRWALIVYRDAGDRYVVRSTDFTSSFEAFDRAIDAQEASGGGDNPEAVLAAFTTAEELRWRRPDVANRLILHVADAPPHPEDLGPSLEAVHRLRAEGTYDDETVERLRDVTWSSSDTAVNSAGSRRPSRTLS